MRLTVLPTAITRMRHYEKIQQPYQLLPPQRDSVLLGLTKKQLNMPKLLKLIAGTGDIKT